MIDHISAVFRVVLGRLEISLGISGPRQQRISSGRLRGEPIKLPASPRIPLWGIGKLGIDPRLAAVGAHSDSRDLGFARPRGAGNDVDAIGCKCFVNTGPSDL